MGIFDIISFWRKRKRDDVQHVPVTKRKKIEQYVVTPDTHKVVTEDQRLYRDVYLYGERILTTETRNFEFKAGGVLFGNEAEKLFMKYGSAFLNSDGGVLLAGVNDDGVVLGVSCSSTQRHRVTRRLEDEMARFQPKVDHKMFSIKFISVEKDQRFGNRNDELFVVEIFFAKGKLGEIYETGDHQVFLRRDGGVHGPLGSLKIRGIILNKYKEMLEERKKNVITIDK